MTATKLPRVAAAAFTLVTEDSEQSFARLSYAVSRARLERNLYGRAADVCGPQGWLFVDGRLAGSSEWEIFEVDYDAGRAQLVLHGYNRNTGETFTWSFFRGQALQAERYGLTHARVNDERAVRFMQLAGFDIA